ncbi:acyl-CoA dehydrogenase family protein [Novosphingobium sp. KACC 22771]|uniref:acyl-CoA dehydrogenase family protein n=1 Tax=Novosphingobium sp. KACC 22771 TaxID=3025670 RepID=UPI00236622D7|nr:acyl-CoA dehydrogenase family protein [Novosphingobium sp. KACC 22771]WDF74352.1 acyl-CoA dehydrogenase family protein [Novosphingobium sp. KACC 22771]
METNEFLDPFDRMLADLCTPASVRAVEAGGDADAMWKVLEESGFLDALVSEEAGGVGLELAQVGPLLAAVGRHAVPLPVGETMLARALLAGAGVACPRGPIVLASDLGGRSAAVPCGRVARHVLIESEGRLVLAAAGALTIEPTGVAHDLGAVFAWNGALVGQSMEAPEGGLLALGAALRACLIAGASERLLDMTIAYANERVQFGKPIGRQQALQQNLAVMAEQVVATRLVAQTVCAFGLPVNPLAVAMAKQVAGSFAAPVANTAHAIHGAIGISEEYDLQLLSRRLHSWRLADGAEGLWAQKLGAARLNDPRSSIDFLRDLAPGLR